MQVNAAPGLSLPVQQAVLRNGLVPKGTEFVPCTSLDQLVEGADMIVLPWLDPENADYVLDRWKRDDPSTPEVLVFLDGIVILVSVHMQADRSASSTHFFIGSRPDESAMMLRMIAADPPAGVISIVTDERVLVCKKYAVV